MSDLNRNYLLTDADLCMYVSNLIQTITRDAEKFEEYGVTVANITAFESLGNSFEVFPPDTFYQGDVGIATEDKDKKREELLLATRKITNRALVKWGQNSPQYKKFGVKGISEMTDREVLAVSRLVALTAVSFLTQLSGEGLTQAVLDNYEDLLGEFENALNNMNNAIENRDMKTIERITLGNQLYALVSRYCTFGKTIWENVNEAKYNDYIIYTSVSPGSLTAPSNLQYNQESGLISWNGVENSTSYKIMISYNGGAFTELYADAGTETYYTPATSPSTFIINAMARNAGGLGPVSSLNVVYNPAL
jgi:hypothetical protein